MKTFLTALLATSALLSGAPASAQMHEPIPITAAEFARALPGSAVELCVRVVRVERTGVQAQILDRTSRVTYRATPASVDLFLADDTPVVMGSTADVTPGAIAVVDAVATAKGRADVKKVVVVTKFVTVKP